MLKNQLIELRKAQNPFKWGFIEENTFRETFVLESDPTYIMMLAFSNDLIWLV